jgi:HTH-type transcriptional regulator/antitoxin HigA
MPALHTIPSHTRSRSRIPVTHPIRTVKEYDAAITEIETLLDHGSPKGSPEYDRLDLLSVLVEAYEAEHYPEPESPTPQAMVDFMLDQKGMTRADLAAIMGGRSRVSDFFAEKRRLSLAQIQKLRDLLSIPADLLIA